MLQQYGIATPSSLTPVSHPEDAQPNEVIKKRRGQGLTPMVASTAPPPPSFSNDRGSGARGRYPPRGGFRGGNRGGLSQQGAPFTQYAIRGKSWRGSSRKEPNFSQNFPARSWSLYNTGTYPTTPTHPHTPFSTSSTTLVFGSKPDYQVDSQSSSKTSYHAANLPSSSHDPSGSTIASSHRLVSGSNFTREAQNSSRNTAAILGDQHKDTGSSNIPFPNASTRAGHNRGWNSMQWLGPPTIQQVQHMLPEPSSVAWTSRGSDAYRGGPTPTQNPVVTTSNSRSDGAASAIHPRPTMPSPTFKESRADLHHDLEVERPTSAENISSAPNQVKPRPPVLPTRKWMFRSRSPSPKLPPTSLKRRKLESCHDVSDIQIAKQVETTNLCPPIEAIAVPIGPPTHRPRVPLPGRPQDTVSAPQARLPTAEHHIKQEQHPSVSLPEMALSPPKSVPKEPIEQVMSSFPKLRPVESLQTTPIKQEMTRPQSPISKKASPEVKKEPLSPTASSPIKPQRRLVKQSVNFYPLPESCAKANPQYIENRKAFFQEQNQALRKLGLKRTKAFYRDDGLVIEWSSPVSVWSDTLEPEIPNLATAMQIFIANSPQRTAKRKREGSIASSPSNKKAKTIEAPAPSPRKIKTQKKHWAAGVPKADMDRVIYRISATPSPPPTSQPLSKTRPPLPTRLHSNAPNSNPAAESVLKPVSKSHESIASEKVKEAPVMSLSQVPPPKRMVFKPMNPRKNIRAAAGPYTASPGAQEYDGSTPNPSRMPYSDTLSQVGRDLGDRSITENQLPQLTSISTPTEVPATDRSSPSALTQSARKTSQLPILKPELSDEIAISPFASRNVSADIDADKVAATLIPEEYSDDGSSNGISSSEEEPEDSAANLALEFFTRFITLFDSDRSQLEMAYAKDALFTCRVHHLQENDFSMAGQFAPEMKPSFRSSHSRATASTVERGRSRICDRLRSLGPHKFRALPGSVVWDMAPLPFGGQGCLMFSTHGEVVHPNQAGAHLDHVLTVDQTFVLRPKTGVDDEDDNEVNGLEQADSKSSWPLVAISHQMTVREGRLLTADSLDSFLPWITNIQ